MANFKIVFVYFYFLYDAVYVETLESSEMFPNDEEQAIFSYILYIVSKMNDWFAFYTVC